MNTVALHSEDTQSPHSDVQYSTLCLCCQGEKNKQTNNAEKQKGHRCALSLTLRLRTWFISHTHTYTHTHTHCRWGKGKILDTKPERIFEAEMFTENST